MWIEAAVLVHTPHADADQRRVLDAAMARRGWDKSGSEGYRTGFTDVTSDEHVVKGIEQDVKQSVYVAGIGEFDAICFLSESAADV